jgi:hypothetical protein
MLMHVLALLDLLAAAGILAGHFDLITKPLLYVAVYLLSKLVFFRDWLTMIDAAAAVYAIALIFMDGGNGLTWLFMIWFLYKTSVWFFYTFAS